MSELWGTWDKSAKWFIAIISEMGAKSEISSSPESHHMWVEFNNIH